ncbi:hypothetical protein HanXRQr2_Chr16g0775541 [Helianthus annuus]|uniref:Uncharacterized protein n=1 Tax=Helianthus annuus TaxID=4232 RepID=A0A9K3DWH7_HELAN|nr:hypothetical protein HanXRQr2_Chr16g0775541 [Helianthus annuus]KAJ0462451.1 hypothetical protein HanHA89_Chr16g0683531 [Helianthus annuus]
MAQAVSSPWVFEFAAYKMGMAAVLPRGNPFTVPFTLNHITFVFTIYMVNL